ncbi:MAG: hypothetical protein HY747_05095 [Elusimicrobia bacterium]|nr:hypothetical protein [Elusimicrobiota bacterium]
MRQNSTRQVGIAIIGLLCFSVGKAPSEPFEELAQKGRQIFAVPQQTRRILAVPQGMGAALQSGGVGGLADKSKPEQDLVLIRAFGEFMGSGVFVADDLILTAGNIVQPINMRYPQACDIEIDLPRFPGLKCSVRQIAIHHEWSEKWKLSKNIALIEVEPLKGQGIPVAVDFFKKEPGAASVKVYGFPLLREVKWPASLAVFQIGELLYTKTHNAVETGVGGGPFIARSGQAMKIIGIATSNNTVPQEYKFIGAPISETALSELEQKLQKKALRAQEISY